MTAGEIVAVVLGMVSVQALFAGLAGWIGGLISDKMRQGRQAELDARIRHLESALETARHIHRAQFDREFEIYRELWERLQAASAIVIGLHQPIALGQREIAQVFGVTTRTIQRWEERGLVELGRQLVDEEVRLGRLDGEGVLAGKEGVGRREPLRTSPSRLDAARRPASAKGYPLRAPKWRNGRRGGLKIRCPKGRVSSNLTFGTRFPPRGGNDYPAMRLARTPRSRARTNRRDGFRTAGRAGRPLSAGGESARRIDRGIRTGSWERGRPDPPTPRKAALMPAPGRPRPRRQGGSHGYGSCA
jgi:hypothetical protein